MGIKIWVQNVMIILEKKRILFWFSFIFGTLVRVPLSFLMVYVWDLQLPGFFTAASFTQLYLVYMVLIIARTNLNEVTISRGDLLFSDKRNSYRHGQGTLYVT